MSLSLGRVPEVDLQSTKGSAHSISYTSDTIDFTNYAIELNIALTDNASTMLFQASVANGKINVSNSTFTVTITGEETDEFDWRKARLHLRWKASGGDWETVFRGTHTVVGGVH